LAKKSHLFAILEGTEFVACRCVNPDDEDEENGKREYQRQTPEPALSRWRHYDDGIYVNASPKPVESSR